MKSRIIHIMNHCPAYEEHSNKARPSINWEIPDGSWVGIWGYDWADLLAIGVRKINHNLEHEIWQPDFRADKLYSSEIFPGVIHRLFPAKETVIRIGLKHIILPYSMHMKTFLNINSSSSAIFHLGQSISCPINESLIEQFTGNKFIFSFHGQISLPYTSLFKFQRNIFAKYHYLREHLNTRRLFSRINFVTYQSKKNLEILKKYYSGQTKQLTMGIDFDSYRDYEKNSCRKELNLPIDKKILLTVNRLYDLKQIDKIIEVLSRIDEDFLYIITGHGTRGYEEYLNKKAESLLKKGRIYFTGYIHGEKLFKIYNSADLFIHVSKSEAGPVSVMEAMACGLPILCTDTGHTAELLKAYDAGIVVGIYQYKKWREKLTDYLQGATIRTLDLNVVRANYDWQSVAKNFLEIYEGV